MSNLIFKVEDEGAEKLWSYLIAYKKMIGKSNPTQKDTIKDDFTQMMIPALEQTKVRVKRHRT